MRVQTFRDAEIELGRLRGEFESLKKTINTSGPVTKAPPPDINNITNNYPLVDPVNRGLLADIPTLVAGNSGYLFYATDYEHLYRWSGTAWEWGPGDCGSGYIVAGVPQGGVWAACDGSAVNVAKEDGTVVSVTTPDLTANVFIQGDSAASAVRAATRATWESTAKSANESTHTHGFDPGAVNTGTPSSVVEVQSGTGTTVADSNHTHITVSTSLTSAAGAAHSHNLTDALSQLKVFDETNGGLPKRIALVWYIRR